MLKDKYEISLWRDKYVKVNNGDGKTDGYFVEEKVAIIGSDTMTAQWRATEPHLVSNVNGTNTFTFKMYYYYIDTETGEKVRNPWQASLSNEQKIKVKWQNKWYDFIIKNCQEDSAGKSITYTCKDQYATELGKNGFDLEFADDLMNSSGTVDELTNAVLEGTDWHLEGADTLI